MNRFARLCLLALSLACGGLHAAEHTTADAAFEFALIGDTPYTGMSHPRFDRTIELLNRRQPELAWVIHTGDIKAGIGPCSDALYLERFETFQRFRMPFILTPGDNEWTDCHRPLAGGYQPLERLKRLREIFYPRPGQTLGRTPMTVETQASRPGFESFPEHVRWERGGVLFAGLHLVGSFNGLNRFPGRTRADDEEVKQRTEAALAWLRDTFAQAKARGSKGVFLFMQANPGFDVGPKTSTARAFSGFLRVLEAEVVAFGRPVLLAHGDTHQHRIDQPLKRSGSGETVTNFTRVENFASETDWVRIRVDPANPRVFSATAEIALDPAELTP